MTGIPSTWLNHCFKQAQLQPEKIKKRATKDLTKNVLYPSRVCGCKIKPNKKKLNLVNLISLFTKRYNVLGLVWGKGFSVPAAPLRTKI